MDIEETGNAWIFEVDVPGARREDLRIDVGDSELVGKMTQQARLPAKIRKCGDLTIVATPCLRS